MRRACVPSTNPAPRRWTRAARAAAIAVAAFLAPAPGASHAVADGGPAAAQPETETLAAALAKAVDLPDPAARKLAAKKLAARPDATLENLLPLMRGFGSFGAAEPGDGLHGAPLWDGKTEVLTEIHVHVPPGYDPAKPAPLLLALHGAGGDGRDEPRRWQAVADALGMLVVAPTDAGRNGGYEFTEAERTGTLSALRWARRHFDVDENRIYCTGISRGGHLTWDLALRHPGVFAAVAPMIGGPRLSNAHGDNNLRFLENAVRTPIRDLQGADDDPLLVANLRMAFDRLAEWKAADARLLVQPGMGHAFDLGAVDWPAWFGGIRRDPSPEVVVRRAVTPSEGRAAWAEIVAVGKGATAEIRPAVDAHRWSMLSEAEKRRTFLDWSEKVTARLEVRRTAPGVFAADAKDVTSFRLLLAEGTFDPAQPVTVSFRGRETKVPVRRDPGVLLADFVERFDRTYLPVAEVVVR